LNEEAIDTTTGKVVISVSEKYYRPTEVETLLGDPTKAKKQMGWKTDICFEELIYDMMNHDMQLYGMKLPEKALQELPTGKLTKVFEYPDLMNSKALGAAAPEVSLNSPVNAI